ncbi:beta-N-acetylglucosaminidase domain-containing protein [Motilibacter deserti]|uniref:beta-N-acetylglucosaminidase domain-containing protein n=1 Tax=Motilibacter deserti TaxID=2714956 RepID=UPI002F2B2A0F
MTALAAPLVGPGAAPASAAAAPPDVLPTPQELTAHGAGVDLEGTITVVTGPGTDAAALRVVRNVLAAAGAVDVDVVDDVAAAADGGPVVFVDGTSDVPGAAEALAALGAQGASGLPAEGYVLAAGRVSKRELVVLDGADAAGAFYAAQTLRQLVRRHGSHATVDGVVVRDWPELPLRGVIEGFYGTPWSHAARKDQLAFYGRHKMNIYVYSPKDDPYLREQWRAPYPAPQLADISDLVRTAADNHVAFTYALSPGLSICYSSESDVQALIAKFQTLYDIGMRDFAVPLDDISYTTWNCPADQARFGTGGGAAGAAQAYVLNRVQREFIETHAGATPLQMVPTEYYDQAETPYKAALRTQLDSDVIVEWTGQGVVPGTITTAQAQQAKAVFGHPVLVWDNYPVNDYATDRLLLAPYTGREAGIAGSILGITSNPMIQPYASKTSVAGVGDFTWNPDAYDPEQSWAAALDELAGPDADVREALRVFGDLNWTSVLDTRQAPVLAPRLQEFWTAWERGDSSAAAAAERLLDTVAEAPATLRAGMADRGFVQDAAPWLTAAELWGRADLAALQMLVELRNGRVERSIESRQRALDLAAQAAAVVYQGLGGTVRVHVGDGVLDTFVQQAVAEHDRALALRAVRPSVSTNLPTYQSYVPANMADGNPDTWFWSSRAVANGDYVGVDLGSVREVSGVTVLMAKATSPRDFIQNGVLEYSVNGTTWTPVRTLVDTAEATATLPAGTSARYVRVRATAAQSEWLVVRELTVTSATPTSPTVTSGPAPAAGSSLGAAADGDLTTAYAAAGSAKGAAPLVVTLPAARPLSRVGVVADAAATVEVRSNGAWRAVGSLSRGYTELPVGGPAVDALRLVWGSTSRPPVVTEVLPWYADVPAVALAGPADEVAFETGSTATVPVSVTSTTPAAVAGTLSAAAPAGLTVTPASSALTVPRGASATVALTIAGAAGTYDVPVTFTPSGGTPVTTTVRVSVHPRVTATNVALASAGTVATAKSVEQDLPQLAARFANDGDTSTRWSSGYDDTAWLQLQFAAPQRVGKVVLRWEASHAESYLLQTSADGTTWSTARAVTASPGGVETLWLDGAEVRYLRVQGVKRSSTWGYSLWEVEAYPVAG